MDKNTEKNSSNIRLTIQIIIAVLACAAIFFSKGKSEFPYSEVNKCTSYLFFHDSDIRGAYDKIMNSVSSILPADILKEKSGENESDDSVKDEIADNENSINNDETNGGDTDNAGGNSEADNTGTDIEENRNTGGETGGSENGGDYNN